MHSMLKLPSFAKINWTLEVLGKRPDGYHELRTILQTVDLADELSFDLTSEGLLIECDSAGIPTDESNLIAKAIREVQKVVATPFGIKVTLTKNIPTEAGLGGGSSNAAVTLLALQKLLEFPLKIKDLLEIARRLGADVPFFFTGGRAIGVGRGDEVYPLSDTLSNDEILLVNCGVRVPTKEAYSLLADRLTSFEGKDIIPFSLEAAYAGIGRSRTVRPELRNDLEAAVFSRYPLLNEVKMRLLSSNAQAVAMSGSGSTVFALFENRTALAAAREEMERSGWWCASVSALGRIEYLEKLGALERADID